MWEGLWAIVEVQGRQAVEMWVWWECGDVVGMWGCGVECGVSVGGGKSGMMGNVNFGECGSSEGEELGHDSSNGAAL